MTNFVNLTPHAITIRTEGGDITIPPSGEVARVATDYVAAGEIGGVPVVRRTLGEVQGIPAPQSDTIYIVSAMVASATTRYDVVAPDTGLTAIRENGQIVAVTRFVAAG